jgi:hypothetical protein
MITIIQIGIINFNLRHLINNNIKAISNNCLTTIGVKVISVIMFHVKIIIITIMINFNHHSHLTNNNIKTINKYPTTIRVKVIVVTMLHLEKQIMITIIRILIINHSTIIFNSNLGNSNSTNNIKAINNNCLTTIGVKVISVIMFRLKIIIITIMRI